uniref:SH3 domain-containing protein n=1 Tax=Oncorhynchus tshawytscha TaxID=74940 RepID=A0A8C8D0J9_ONCTS
NLKANVHLIYIWTFTIFLFPTLTWGLLSDFKICGDSECESLLSRVRATRDHRGKDCRFLNFKKGDVIFVYHKLSGKRDDLWAGSIDRRFGYFSKDAVEVDEIYSNTEKEVATQKQDFFCIDEYGSLIDNDSSEWDNEENLVSEFQEIAANDAQDSKTSKDAFLSQSFAQSSDETGNKDAIQVVMEHFSDDTKPEPSEQEGSQWIGSTVTGWLSLGGENPDDNPKEDNPEQESFRSRKLALDIDVNQLKEEKKNAENSGWFGDGLTSAFGFGQKAPEEEKPIEKEVEEQPPPSNSWLNIGIRDVLHFGQSNQDKVEEIIEAAGRDPQDLGTSQSHHDATVEQIKETEHQRDDTTGKKAERTETHPSKPVKDYNQEDRHSQEEDGELRKEEDAGWYGSIYNNIVGLYGEQGYVEEEEDILIAEDEEDKDIKGIKKLENEKASLQTDSEKYTGQVQKLQQKLQIMTEMYQENELKLHRMLTVEERERLQKDEKLTKADKSITLAVEELNSYRQRAQDLEDELEKTNQAYKTQITSQEKKAHNNWLAARGADRDLAEVKRENAHLRQKLTDTQFKLDVVEKDPYTLDNMDRPLSPYGPSPLHRPASENRAFLSPPTLMDGPLRLSPNFPPMGPGGRVSRGLLDPPGGVDSDRSGGPHSDSGSISPTWERDRRGPPIHPPGTVMTTRYRPPL